MLPRQKERLVDLMEADFISSVRRHSSVGEAEKSEKWNKYATELNWIGPPFKTGEEWQATADEVFCSAKEKVRDLRKHQNGTGGGSSSTIFVSDLDRKLIKLYGKNHLDGQQNLNELGFADRQIEPIRALDTIQDGPSTQSFDEIEILSDESDETLRVSNRTPLVGVSNRTSSTTLLRSLSTGSSSGAKTKNVKRLGNVPKRSVCSDKKPKTLNTFAERLNDVRKRYDKKTPQNAKDVKGVSYRPTSYEMVQQGLVQQREFLEQSNRNHVESTSALKALTAAIENLAANKN